MQKIRPFLLFNDDAEEAATFYASIFPNSKIANVSRYGDDGPGPSGKAMVVVFELDGQTFMGLNMFQPQPKEGGPAFYVSCKTQNEVDRYWERLCEGGAENACGWLKDRYGVAWNVVPDILGDLLSDEDDEKSGRVMKAMLGMVKLDIAGLQAAYDGRDVTQTSH